MCKEYSKHLMHLTETSPQLLITYEYDQTVVAGPPFSVSKDAVHEHYDAACIVKHLARIVAPLRGGVPAGRTYGCCNRDKTRFAGQYQDSILLSVDSLDALPA